jgi:hypothetical protein
MASNTLVDAFKNIEDKDERRKMLKAFADTLTDDDIVDIISHVSHIKRRFFIPFCYDKEYFVERFGGDDDKFKKVLEDKLFEGYASDYMGVDSADEELAEIIRIATLDELEEEDEESKK